MPRRDDIHSIMVIGSGPIVIGQACEFDYSGTQACQVLREEGFKVILVNSNPATIMTDPATADVTYIEPLDADVLTDIIERERPDALLPTLGGQTALNLTMELVRRGVTERLGVEVIGARPEAIATAEDRELFKAAMADIGLAVPESGFARSVDEAVVIAREIGWPIIIRPSFILGGAGTGIAHDEDHLANSRPRASPRRRWARYSWRSRSRAGRSSNSRSCATSRTTASSSAASRTSTRWACTPATRSPSRRSKPCRTSSIRPCATTPSPCCAASGSRRAAPTCSSPSTRHRRTSRHRDEPPRQPFERTRVQGDRFPDREDRGATGGGVHVDEIRNDITKVTPSSFEPVIDYVVTKIPRWAFEKLPGAAPELGTRMQSVGEVMAIGRNFAESLQKAVRSLEQGRSGFALGRESEFIAWTRTALWHSCVVATPERLFALHELLWRGAPIDEVVARTKIDAWFIHQLSEIVERERELANGVDVDDARRARLAALQAVGILRPQIGDLTGRSAAEVTALRRRRRRRDDVQDRRHLRRGVRRRRRRITTAPTRTPVRCSLRRATASSSSARVPIVLARASSSTTAACTPRSSFARWATRPSW
jgi:carbamoyl-phosphate synthase large subunit